MEITMPAKDWWVHSQEQLYVKLKELYDKGYRYIVRDKDSNYVHCYSLKPKKYRELDCWGYPNPLLPGVLPAYPIKNQDCAEIHWSNKTALTIESLIPHIFQDVEKKASKSFPKEEWEQLDIFHVLGNE